MNPNAPPRPGGPPTSFKTNVNRAKTKRWVEAKSYSYDGDDWGEVDDYDEYGGYDNGPVQKPTGLRQQGQSMTPMSGPSQARQEFLQSPIESNEQQYIAPGGQPSQLQQEYGGQSAVSSPPFQQHGHERTNSFNQGDERRAFSAGTPQYGMSNNSGLPFQPQYQQEQATPQVNSQMRIPSQGQQPYQQPSQVNSRPSYDGQPRPMGQGPPPPPANYRGVSYSDRPGSRTQSMTSSTSSADYHGRRDFSPSALPQPLHTQARDHPPRMSSLSQEDTPRAPSGTFPASVGGPPIPFSGGIGDDADPVSKPLPFVRPADIYKRMAEEKERERQSQESSRPSMEAITSSRPPPPLDEAPNNSGGRPDLETTRSLAKGQRSYESGDEYEEFNRSKPSLEPVAERKSEYGIEGLNLSPTSDLPGTVGNPNEAIPQQNDRAVAVQPDRDNGPRLPDVPRMSGFGESFLGSMGGSFMNTQDLNTARNKPPDVPNLPEHLSPQDSAKPSLQHQPSAGFRSAVSKAFEDQVPPTPSSTSGSAVARSNSESTNAISPIISRVPSAVNPETRLKGSEAREDTVPVIAEESGTGTSRPASQDMISIPRQIPSQPSPYQNPPTDSSYMTSTPTITSHRRNISTPSPDNSPARTPAVEVNNQLRQPQEAELAVTTPTSMTHSSSSASNALPPFSVEDSRGTANHGQLMENVDSPVTPVANSAFGRADSPSKTRVRDLADQFENGEVSRQGSKSSLKGNLSSLRSGSADDSMVPRPPADRMESFRPNLPGGWDSFTSITPTAIPTSDATGTRVYGRDPTADDRSIPSVASSRQQETPSMALGRRDDGRVNTSLDQTSDENMDINPTTVKRTLSKSPEKPSIIEDPFSAVAAAGAALAGAFTAAVGMDQNNPDDDHKASSLDARPEDFTAARGRNASIKNSDFHPEATKPWMYPEDDSASSVAPTPISTVPGQQDSSAENPNYFPPVVPLRQRPHPIETPSERTPVRPQVLPTMSTETSPNDYESDRLRKEIVRELSPHVEHFPEEQFGGTHRAQASHSSIPATSVIQRQDHDSMFLPTEYDSYWNGSNSGRDSMSHRTSHLDAASPEMHEESQHSEEKIAVTAATLPAIEKTPAVVDSTQHETADNDNSNMLQVRPAQLTHRFSWEPEPESFDAPAQSTAGNGASVKPASSVVEDQGMQNAFVERWNADQRGSANQIETVTEAPNETRDLERDLPIPTVLNTDSEVEGLMQNTSTIHHVGENLPLPPLPSEQPKIPAFREILAIKNPRERIQTYNQTREQFANMNTGLEQWITATLNNLPEHSELLKNGGTFGNIAGQRPSPSRGKFPGIRAVSGQPNQSPQQQQYLSAGSSASPNSNLPGSSGLNNSPSYSPGSTSGRNSGLQMQAKGKDLLHTAGLFGGKASTATKGLFSKGRSKFRGSGGADKAFPSTSAPPLPDPRQDVDDQYQLPPNSQAQATASSLSSEVKDNTEGATRPRSLLVPPKNRSRPVSSTFTNDEAVPKLSDGPISPLLNDDPFVSNVESQSRTPRDESQIFSSTASESERQLKASIAPALGTFDRHHHQTDSRGSSTYVEPSAIIGNRTGTVSQQSSTSPFGSPEEVRSPKSAGSSSNRTPTQADFRGNGWVHDLPLPPELSSHPTATTVTEFRPHENHNETPGQSIPELSGSESTSAMRPIDLPLQFSSGGTNPRDRVLPDASTVMISSQTKQTADTPPRISEDSEETYHTADSGEDFRMRPDAIPAVRPLSVQASAGPVSQSNSLTQKPGLNIARGVPNLSQQTPSRTSIAAENASDSKALRPFSFIEFSQMPTDDLALRGSSIDSRRDTANRRYQPPSTSAQQQGSLPRNQATAAYHGLDHDFITDSNQLSGRPRNRSFSRPFKDPNQDEHPAFRQNNVGDEDTSNLPSHYYPPQIRREDAMIAGKQATEYQLDGVGPPMAEQLNSKPQSRRGSRSSAFFKNFTSPVQPVPPIPNGKDLQISDSSAASPVKIEKRRKRGSLFRSLTGHTGSDSSRSRENSLGPASNTGALQPGDAYPKIPSREDRRSFTNPIPNPTPSHSTTKLQRASTSGVPEQNKGKKKRFSGLGSLFSKSSSKQQAPVIPAPDSTLPSVPAQYQAPYSQGPQKDPHQQPVTTSPIRHNSAYYTNHHGYAQPGLPADYDHPPLDGYYSPDRMGDSFPMGSTNEQQPRNLPSHTAQPTQFPSQYQSDYQTSRAQPQSTWERNSMLHQPQPTSRPYSDQMNSTENPATYDKNRRSTEIPSQPFPPRQSSQHTPSPYHIQTSNVNPNATRPESSMLSPQGYREVPIGPSRSESPPPPPPPPKDDYLRQGSRAHVRASSQNPPPTRYSVSPSAQARQSLPPLQTNNPPQNKYSFPGKAVTPEDVRRERQRQIERSGLTPERQTANNPQYRSRDADEEIVMSSSSYPGQEWQPHHGSWENE